MRTGLRLLLITLAPRDSHGNISDFPRQTPILIPLSRASLPGWPARLEVDRFSPLREVRKVDVLIP